MSLIFDALQRMGHDDNSSKKKQDGTPAKRNAYSLRRIFFSPTVLLTVAGSIFLAGIFTVQISRSLSERITSTPPVIDNLSLSTDPSEPVEQVTLDKSRPGIKYIPGGELEDISYHPISDHPIGTPASVDANATFQVHFFAPEQQQHHQLNLNDHTHIEPKAAGPSNPAESPVQIMDIEGGHHETTTVSVDEYQKIVESKISESALKLSSLSPLKPDAKQRPVQSKEKQTSKVLPHVIASTVSDDKADQAAFHLEMAQLVGEIKIAVQSDDHIHTDELFKELEARQKPGSLFVLKLKAYRELQRGNLEEARRLLVRVLLQKPDDRESGLNMAVVDMRSGRFDDAHRRLTDLNNLYPEDHLIALSLDESQKMVSSGKADNSLKTDLRD